MPREEVSFARGTKSTMPNDKVPGRLLIATDTGEAYVDDTTASRVQLKDSTKVSKSGDTMNGALNMSSHKITSVATPTADTDAANLASVKSQVNTAIKNAQYTGTSPISVDNTGHTISHNNIGSAGSVGPTANSTASHGGTITVPYITVDAKGHVSAKANRTITLPAGPTNMRGASTSAAGAAGYAPAPSAGAANRYLRSDGTWSVPPDTNTTYSNMRGASSSAAGSSGLVPAPAAGASTRYLRSDGTWQVPPNTTYSNMRGATSSAAGSSGLVPAPAAGYNTSFLRGDGTWAVPTGGTYTAGRGLSLFGTEIGHATSITADNRGPADDATVSPGSGFTVPQIYYDAYGHITSSAVNRTLTLDSTILDTGDILTSLSGVTSNEKVLGAKLVADAINNLTSQVSTLNNNMSDLSSDIDNMKSIQTISSGYSAAISLTHLSCVAYKIGRIVFLYGYVRNGTNGITTNGEIKVVTLPSSIKPVSSYVVLAVLNSSSIDIVTEGIIHNSDNAVYIQSHPNDSTNIGKSYIHFSGMYISQS